MYTLTALDSFKIQNTKVVLYVQIYSSASIVTWTSILNCEELYSVLTDQET